MAKLTIDTETCIGCGACSAVAPELLEMDYDENKAKVLKAELNEENLQQAKDAVETCPVQCLKIED